MTRECDRYGRYLIGVQPGELVRRKYEEGLARFPDRFGPRDRLDRTIWRLGNMPFVPVRSVDMAARFLSPASALRRRLVFLTALLESSSDTYQLYESPNAGKYSFFLGLAGRGLISTVALAVGLVLVCLAYPFSLLSSSA